jgi:hypothetical protein
MFSYSIKSTFEVVFNSGTIPSTNVAPFALDETVKVAGVCPSAQSGAIAETIASNNHAK